MPPLTHPLSDSPTLSLSLLPTKLVPLSLTHKLTVNILLRSQLTHHQNRNHDARLRRIQCRGSVSSLILPFFVQSIYALDWFILFVLLCFLFWQNLSQLLLLLFYNIFWVVLCSLMNILFGINASGLLRAYVWLLIRPDP